MKSSSAHSCTWPIVRAVRRWWPVWFVRRRRASCLSRRPGDGSHGWSRSPPRPRRGYLGGRSPGPGVAPQSVAENRKPAAQEKTEPAAPIRCPNRPAHRTSRRRRRRATKRQGIGNRLHELRKDADRPEVDLLKRESQAASGSAALADNAAAATAAPAPAAPAPAVAPPAREAFQSRSATQCRIREARGERCGRIGRRDDPLANFCHRS